MKVGDRHLVGALIGADHLCMPGVRLLEGKQTHVVLSIDDPQQGRARLAQRQIQLGVGDLDRFDFQTDLGCEQNQPAVQAGIVVGIQEWRRIQVMWSQRTSHACLLDECVERISSLYGWPAEVLQVHVG